MNNINNNIFNTGRLSQENSGNSTELSKNNNIMVLPDDCIKNILSNLDSTQDILTCSYINKRLLNIIDNTAFLEINCFNSYYAAKNNPKLSVSYYNLELCNWLKNFDDEIIEYLDANIKSINFKQILFFTIVKVISKTRNFTFEKIATIKHSSRIHYNSCNVNTDILVTLSYYRTIATIWQFKNKTWGILNNLNHEEKITHSIFSPDDRYFFTFSQYKIKIWEFVDNNYYHKTSIETHDKSDIFFREDSKRFFIKIKDRDAKIFDLLNNTWVEVCQINNLSEFFYQLQSDCNQNILLENEIQNDTWLKFILQLYFIIQSTCSDDPFYTLNQFQKKIQNMVYGITDYQSPPVSVICYSLDKKLIYIGTSTEAHCTILEYTNKEWQVKIKFQGDLGEACFSPDNKRIITSYDNDYKQDHQAIIWNITGNIAEKEASIVNVYTAKFSPDGMHIVTTSSIDCHIQILGFIDKIWQVKAIIDYRGDGDRGLYYFSRGYIKNTYFSNDGRFITSISSDREVNILEITGALKNKPIETIDHTSKVTAIATSSAINKIYLNSNFIITISTDKKAQVWQLTSGLWRQQGESLINAEDITNFIFSPDKLHLITTSDCLIKIWGLTNNSWQQKTSIKNNYKSNIYFREDSNRLFITVQASGIKIFDLINNNWLLVLTIDNISEVFNPTEHDFKQNISLDNNIKNDTWLKFILQKYCITQSFCDLYAHKCYGPPDRKKGDDEIFENRIKDIVFGTSYWKTFMLTNSYPMGIICYSEDLKLIYISSSTNAGCTIFEHTNQGWDVKVKFLGDTNNACFSPDNKKIITMLADSKKNIYNVNIWDITENKAKHESCLRNVCSANFSADSKYIVTISSTEYSAKIWELVDDKWKVKIIINHKIKTTSNFFDSTKILQYAYLSSDNKFITTIAADKTVKISDIHHLLQDAVFQS